MEASKSDDKAVAKAEAEAAAAALALSCAAETAAAAMEKVGLLAARSSATETAKKRFDCAARRRAEALERWSRASATIVSGWRVKVRAPWLVATHNPRSTRPAEPEWAALVAASEVE